MRPIILSRSATISRLHLNRVFWLMTIAVLIIFAAGCGKQDAAGGGNHAVSPRIIRVSQAGDADVVGNDDVALQKAANMLKPGDTLEIGPGTYEMNNSLFIPSQVTVRGIPVKRF